MEIIKSLIGPNVKLISEPDKGIYDAMNKGIALATGDVVGTLNADDVFYDNRVISDVDAAFGRQDIDCVYGNLVYLDREEPGKVTRKWVSCEFRDGLFEKSWTPAHPTFYCRKELFNKYGFYRLDFKIAADVELMYRFLQKHRIRTRYLDRIMVKMLSSGISNSGIASTITITREMKKAIIDNGGKFNLAKYLFFKAFKIKQALFK